MPVLSDIQLIIPGPPDDMRGHFNRETRCVAALIERLLPKITTADSWKVLFKCVGAVRRDQYLVSGGVCELEVQADVEQFFTLSDPHKKEWTLQVIEDGMGKLLPQTGWPQEPFQQAIERARALGLVNEYVWRKPLHAPTRKMTAEILVQHDVRACDISMIIRHRSGQILRRELLISEMPSEFSFYWHLGALKWQSATRVALINRDGDRSWVVDL